MKGTAGILARCRPASFVLVGGLGVLLQLAVLEMLTSFAGWHDLAATAVAVAATVIHNFAWHQRWTWADRPAPTRREAGARLVRFILTNGLISIAGNVGLMMLYTGPVGLPRLPANMLAIGTMSVLNFLAADRWVFSSLPRLSCGVVPRRLTTSAALAAALCLTSYSPTTAAEPAAEPKSETVAAWTRYVERAEARISRRNADASSEPKGRDGAHQVVVANRDIAIEEVTPTDDAGREVDVPAGAIHHWKGTVLLRGVDLNEVLEAAKHPIKQPGVLDLRVLDRTTDSLRLYLKLVRHQIITVTYNTEHDIHFARHSPSLASCRSVATRIAELADAGQSTEHERASAEDHGFMWRLNAYWRYQQTSDGVLVEMESLTLSRRVPFLVGPLLRPIVDKIARESISQTLEGFRQRFVR